MRKIGGLHGRALSDIPVILWCLMLMENEKVEFWNGKRKLGYSRWVIRVVNEI